MVVRTTTREAMSRGMANRLLDHGRVEVEISQHVGSCEICKPFEGKRFSLTDAGTAPLLEKLPPFHPNCRHVLTPARTTFEEMEAALGLGPNLEAPMTAGPDAPPPIAQEQAFDLDPGLPDDARAGTESAGSVLAELLDLDKIGRPGVELLPESDAATARLFTERRAIGVSDSSPATVRSSLFHEFGHFLDRYGLGSDAGEDFSAGGKITRLLKETPTMKRIYPGDGRESEVAALRGDNQMRNYFWQGREAFARAFDQFVAMHDEQERAVVDRTLADPFLSFQYWTWEEFEPIAREFERLLAKHDLLRVEEGRLRPTRAVP
jgi:hypothetical protein